MGASSDEVAARSTKRGEIALDNEIVSDRPLGETAIFLPFVQWIAAIGEAPSKFMSYVAGSTDANIPMSLGRPAVTPGRGFVSFRAHSLKKGLEVNRTHDFKSIAPPWPRL